MMNIFRLYADEKSDYQSNDAIQWYLNNSFLQKLITKLLQRKDIDQLYQLRYFLVDFIENFVIHQQMKLSKHELNHFKQKHGQMMSMKGFLLVKQDILLPQRSDLVDVHLEIKYNLKEYQNKNEVLFDLSTTFQLKTIEKNDQKFLIQLTAVSYGHIIQEKYLKDTDRQIENLSIPIIFNKLMCDMNEWHQSRKYLQYLLIHSNEQDLLWIEYFIGQTLFEIGQLNEARLCYDRAIKSNKINLQDSALILSAICKVLYSQGKYVEAYDFYPSNHTHITNSLENIALIFHIRLQYDQALEYQTRVITICKEYYQSNHTYIALLLYRTGYILYQQEIMEEALNLNQQVLTIMKNLCSSSHPDVLYVLTKIGHIRYGQGMYEESSQLYQQVLALFIQLYSSDHIDSVYALVNVGDILLDGKENSEQALDFYQKSLTMLERSYPTYYAYIANNFNLIGNVLEKQMKFDQALEIYNRALKMQEDFYLPEHIELIDTLANISHILSIQEKSIGKIYKNQCQYDQAPEYYQQALNINEKYYSSNHIQLASNLILIGNVPNAQEKFNEALAIREKDLPYSYTTVLSNLMDIGRIKVNQSNFDGALDDFSRAVALLQEYDPLNHSELVIDLEWIASIYNQKQCYHRAIEYLQQCLLIQEASLSPKHVSIVKTLTILAEVHRKSFLTRS
ncbi:unnamed protein product [Adineta steineri]|uniref:Uncharacterized protein n=2 Tax=Adineta steineri TaxID=433720 RepID=A0A819WYT4_9BILA|nr:unnamed protein product [Adineta steineri]CAF4131107.1 unnamed protein product [Adineta steineri]